MTWSGKPFGRCRARGRAAGHVMMGFLSMLAGPARAQVVPSGTTPTAATVGIGGQVNVTIAPPNGSGISLNQYQTFSVPSAGVNLFNQGVNAGTIVNQVTSDNRSYLTGPLSVIGPAAHVILVNPSGITVNGGRFVNTGGVALSTGSLSLTGPGTAGGPPNIVLGSGNGDILVTGAGLTGTMASLQLIAARIKIDGPVVNASADPNADVRLVAGEARVSLDPSVLPGSTLRPWVTGTTTGGTSSDILIDVTPNGSISASRIAMVVGAQGAGVSFQGRGTAAIGEFTIDASGKVAILGGRIQAERAVRIAAPAIEVLNAGPQTAQISAITGGVTLLASAGDINITGQITGAQRNEGDPASRGGVTLNASGAIRLLTENANRLAIVFSSRDDLSVTAGGDITNNTGRLLSNSRIFINAGGTFSNIVDVTGATAGGAAVATTATGHHWWWPWQNWSSVSIAYNFGSLRVPDQLAYVLGSSIFIQAANVRNSGNIIAQNGTLQINTGVFEDVAPVTGTAWFVRSCFILCTTRGGSTVAAARVNGDPAGLVTATGAMEINATTRIVNMGGVILSEGNLALNSPSILASAVFAPQTAALPGGLYNLFGGTTAFLYGAPVGGTFLAPYGGIVVTTGAPVTLNGGALQAAAGVSNPRGVETAAPAQPVGFAPGDLGTFRIGIFSQVLP